MTSTRSNAALYTSVAALLFVLVTSGCCGKYKKQLLSCHADEVNSRKQYIAGYLTCTQGLPMAPPIEKWKKRVQ